MFILPRVPYLRILRVKVQHPAWIVLGSSQIPRHLRRRIASPRLACRRRLEGWRCSPRTSPDLQPPTASKTRTGYPTTKMTRDLGRAQDYPSRMLDLYSEDSQIWNAGQNKHTSYTGGISFSYLQKQ